MNGQSAQLGAIATAVEEPKTQPIFENMDGRLDKLMQEIDTQTHRLCDVADRIFGEEATPLKALGGDECSVPPSIQSLQQQMWTLMSQLEASVARLRKQADRITELV